MSDTFLRVLLMRGLPGCGKSYTAQSLAKPHGVVLETDRYFYTEVGDDPDRYDYSDCLLPAARQWNFERFCDAIEQSISPIVVDRGNGLNEETRQYAAYAVGHGYEVSLAEPESPWWQELRILLMHKDSIDSKLLDQWAQRLADSTRQTHRVPAKTIRRWMDRWRHDLTVQEILQSLRDFRRSSTTNVIHLPIPYFHNAGPTSGGRSQACTAAILQSQCRNHLQQIRRFRRVPIPSVRVQSA